MKKNHSVIFIIILILVLAFLAFFFARNYTKVSHDEITISKNDNNSTVNIENGNILNVTLTNPGDGGYQFDEPAYDTNLLKLLSHEHTNAKDAAYMVGNFGTDTWKFEAISSGQTELIFNIYRACNNEKATYFEATININ